MHQRHPKSTDRWQKWCQITGKPRKLKCGQCVDSTCLVQELLLLIVLMPWGWFNPLNLEASSRHSNYKRTGVEKSHYLRSFLINSNVSSIMIAHPYYCLGREAQRQIHSFSALPLITHHWEWLPLYMSETARGIRTRFCRLSSSSFAQQICLPLSSKFLVEQSVFLATAGCALVQ